MIIAVADPLYVVGVAMIAGIAFWCVGLCAGALAGSASTSAAVRGAGVTVAAGMAVLGLVATLSYRLFGNGIAPIVPLVSITVVAVLSIGVLALRGRSWARRVLRSGRPTWLDLAAMSVACAVLAPLIANGPSYWTFGSNDFPSYAASVESWQADAGRGIPFLERHPDYLGGLWDYRAGLEKPVVTAVMTVMSELSGVEAYRLLGPTMFLGFAVLIACLMAVSTSVWPQSRTSTAAAVLIPSLSVVPMTRVFDAQPGHVYAIAFMAGAAALLLKCASLTAPRWQVATGGGLVGCALAAMLGSNATLVLGSAPAWGAMFFVLLADARVLTKRTLNRIVFSVVLAAVLSAPLVVGYRQALRVQTGGEPGYPVDLPNPLAALGLQLHLESGMGTAQTLVAWGAVFGILGMGTVLTRGRVLWSTWLLIGAVAVNGLVIMVKVGATNYASHKWVTLVFAFVLPLVAARAVTRLPRTERRTGMFALTVLATVSAAIAFQAARRVPVVAPVSLLDLAESPALDVVNSINVDLGDLYQNSIMALALETPEVVVTGESYATPSNAVGDAFLTDGLRAQLLGAEAVVPLGGGHVLATLDLRVDGGEPVEFSSKHPDAERYLYGEWHELESSGVWSSDSVAAIVLDVPDRLRGRDLMVSIIGARYAEPMAPRDVVVEAGYQELARETFTTAAPREFEVSVPAGLVGDDGRLALTLRSPDPLSPSQFGASDLRKLGFMLESIEIRGVH